MREELADAMFRNIPVGVGVNGDIPCSMEELDKILRDGINWAIGKGYAWKEDRDHCEDNGRMETADPKYVSNRAKRRGLKQLGTLGAGNHYAEIQVVDEIYNQQAASTMGIGQIGQVCIMIHTGSRGLGHQVATDALTVMERAMARDRIELNDRQLSCARISSHEGKEYLCECDRVLHFLAQMKPRLLNATHYLILHLDTRSCHVFCSQFCMGQPLLYHISNTQIFLRGVPSYTRRDGDAFGVRRLS